MRKRAIEKALLDSLRKEETLREKLAGVKARLHGLRELRRELLGQLDKKDRRAEKQGGLKRHKEKDVSTRGKLRTETAPRKRKTEARWKGGRWA